MSIKIKDLREKFSGSQELKTIIIDGQEVTVVNTKPLKQQVDIIDQIIDLCIEKEQFFNPFKLDIITKVLIVKNYTNLEISQEDLVSIYETYDCLNWSGAFDKILPLIEDYDYIVQWSSNCVEKICTFYNSFLGTLQGIKADQNQEQLLAQLENALKEVKENPDVQKVLPFIQKKV